MAAQKLTVENLQRHDVLHKTAKPVDLCSAKLGTSVASVVQTTPGNGPIFTPVPSVAAPSTLASTRATADARISALEADLKKEKEGRQQLEARLSQLMQLVHKMK